MSDGRSLAEILVSQLGTPRDPMAEMLGAGMVLLLLVAYVGLEYGIGRALLGITRSIRSKLFNRSDPPS